MCGPGFEACGAQRMRLSKIGIVWGDGGSALASWLACQPAWVIASRRCARSSSGCGPVEVALLVGSGPGAGEPTRTILARVAGTRNHSP